MINLDKLKKLSKKKIFFILAPVLIVITYFAINTFVPKNNISSKFGVQLPANTEIINFTNKLGYCEAKIMISESDNISFTNACAKGYGILPDSELKLGEIPGGLTGWWDLNYKNIAKAYFRFSDVWTLSGTTQGEYWIFVTKPINGKVCIYLSYAD